MKTTSRFSDPKIRLDYKLNISYWCMFTNSSVANLSRKITAIFIPKMPKIFFFFFLSSWSKKLGTMVISLFTSCNNFSFTPNGWYLRLRNFDHFSNQNEENSRTEGTEQEDFHLLHPRLDHIFVYKNISNFYSFFKKKQTNLPLALKVSNLSSTTLVISLLVAISVFFFLMSVNFC